MNEEPQEPAVAADEPAEEALAVHVDPDEAPDLADADESKPTPEELVLTQERSVYEVMDAHDVDQIINEMQGRLLDVALYDFSSGGQRQTELSWKGVRECVKEMNRTGKCRLGIDKDTLQTQTVVEDGDVFYEAAVYAKDEVSGEAYYGFAREPKMMQKRDGSAVPDKFAKTKAINKSMRNALRMCVPERLAQTLIAQFLHDERRVKQLRSESPMVGRVAELPPPVETEEGKALIREIDGLWDQVQATEGFASTMTPAHFFAYKTRATAQNPDDPEDVTMLVQFRDTLLQTLETVRRKAGIVEGTASDA